MTSRAIVLVLAALQARPDGAANRGVRWGELVAIGRAPAQVRSKVRAHVRITLRELGLELTSSSAVTLSARARCRFVPSGPASCVVEVRDASAPRQAERRAEIPYRDADDFAQTLALMVADALQGDLHVAEVPASPPTPPLAAPEESVAPASPSTPEATASSIRQAPAAAPPAPARVPPEAPSPPSRPAPSADAGPIQHPPTPADMPHASAAAAPARARAPLTFVLGPLVAVDGGDAPPLYGLRSDLAWTLGPVRLGGGATVAGGQTSQSGYQLSFLRVVAGPQIELATTGAEFQLGAAAGPGLLVLHTSATPGGTHTLAALAGRAEGNLTVAVGRHTGVRLGTGVLVPATRQRVVAGMEPVLSFGEVSLELSLGVLYAR